MILVRSWRIWIGVLVLVLVNCIWVSSSELTEYIYHGKSFDKPFFTTYVKTCLFTVYFAGFLFFESWRREASQWFSGYCYDRRRRRNVYSRLEQVDDEGEDTVGFAGGDIRDLEAYRTISDPIWIPIKYSDSDALSDKDLSDDNCSTTKKCNLKSVRFSNLTEVRQLSEVEGNEALVARLPHDATISALRSAKTLSMPETAKLSAMFCLVWFVANFSYQNALVYSEAGLVSVLSCTSSLFTLVLASYLPRRLPADDFSFTKLVTITLTLCSVALISSSEVQLGSVNLPVGTFWALVGALSYAGYTLLMRYKVEDESCLDMPLFFGFVGFFNALFLWPGLLILHHYKIEPFRWPDAEQWFLILVNGLIGTVLSELLWLWGCFLTSSIVATLSLSLTVPLTVFFDLSFKSVTYPSLFYLGSIPLLVCFMFLSLLCHHENTVMSKWDPLANFLCKLVGGRYHHSSSKINNNAHQKQIVIDEDV